MIAFERVVGAPSSIIIKNVTSYREIYYYRWPGEYSPALYLPVWSPDGSKIAFWQASEIYIGDTPTTIDDARIESSSDPREGLFPANVTPLGPHASYGIPGFHGRVSWSPDSKMLAFDRLSGDHYDIFAIRVDGTGLVKLASGWEPAWSPDGDKIAFVKDGQIHVMYLDFTPTEESFPVAPTLFIVLAIVLGSATFLLKHKKKS
jgi:Tol biopolymer transport system component